MLEYLSTTSLLQSTAAFFGSVRRVTPAAAVLVCGVLVAGCSQPTNSGTGTNANANANGNANGVSASSSAGSVQLLNVSYDPTREFYQQYDAAFSAWYLAKTGRAVVVNQSHGGSGKQARSVINGQDADVVTLALGYDVDAIAQSGLLSPKWESKFPMNASPYTSVIVFLVQKGNPKHIKDWGDLVKPGVKIVTANPKTSGGARLNYLSAWGYALHHNAGSEAAARAFVTALYGNVTNLPSGSRDASTAFTRQGTDDVLISWENEADLSVQNSAGQFEVVTPSESILAEPPVAVVDVNAKKHGTTQVAHDYLQYLYSPQAQEIAAKNFYRPRDAKVAAKYAAQFPVIKTWTLKSLFGDWSAVQKKHFADGGIFDSIYTPHA